MLNTTVFFLSFPFPPILRYIFKHAMLWQHYVIIDVYPGKVDFFTINLSLCLFYFFALVINNWSQYIIITRWVCVQARWWAANISSYQGPIVSAFLFNLSNKLRALLIVSLPPPFKTPNTYMFIIHTWDGSMSCKNVVYLQNLSFKVTETMDKKKILWDKESIIMRWKCTLRRNKCCFYELPCKRIKKKIILARETKIHQRATKFEPMIFRFLNSII